MPKVKEVNKIDNHKSNCSNYNPKPEKVINRTNRQLIEKTNKLDILISTVKKTFINKVKNSTVLGIKRQNLH